MDAEKYDYLISLCKQFRIDVIELLYKTQSGHAGGSLSVCEILTAIYFAEADINTENKNNPERDRVILTKGHAAPMLYRVLAEKGFIPLDELSTLRKTGTRLQGHPAAHIEGIGVELSTGPLGIGLSAAVGMAIANKIDGYENYVFAVTGDGELNEGVVWEAVMSAVKFELDNLIIIVDYNKVQLDGISQDIMPMINLAGRLKSFGCNVNECDGHDISDICKAVELAKLNTKKPSVILAHTIKGKGVSFMEGESAWHGAPVDQQSYEKAMKELRG